MKSGLSLIVKIIDASSSMAKRELEVIDAVNQSLKKHREAPGEALVSIYQFADETTNIVDFKNVNDVVDFKYHCCGMTALHDAMGYVIESVGKKLAAMPESERPEQVQVMVITDGGENASRKYTSAKVSEMVRHQTDKYSWIFTYVGSNQDAIMMGGSLGISAQYCANYTDANLSKTFDTITTKSLSARRFSKSADLAFNSMAYSSVERESLVQ